MKLGIGPDNTRELRLLSRDEIVSVIKSVSLLGPDQIIYEIVNQAEGKPGLAVLLSLLCLGGNEKKFWTGDLLSDWVLFSLSHATGQKPQEILAAFSLGGEAGMPMQAVAKGLAMQRLLLARLRHFPNLLEDLEESGIALEAPQLGQAGLCTIEDCDIIFPLPTAFHIHLIA